ncbi:MAG: ATP-binding protein [Candidatus Bathyarchaeia archaeon]|jgi:DNA helicase HerA-like ATPase
MTVCGQIVAGEVGKILIREKGGEKIELGDLLVVEDPNGYTIMQVYDLLYGSQISQLAREQLAGLKLEGFGVGLDFFEPQLRNYVLAEAKAVLRMTDHPQSAKVLPDFFGMVRHVEQKDLPFLSKPDDPIYIGKVRSGSKIIDVPVYLNGQEALTHHILIPSATGRGKSNLVKVMLWSIIGQSKFGILVLDAHDEYYGRTGKGLKDHNRAKEGILYYSINPVPGTSTLIINLRTILPDHLNGIIPLTDAQDQAVRRYHQEFKENWIEDILRGTTIEGAAIKPVTLGVLQRIIKTKLSIYIENNEIACRNRVFSSTGGDSTIKEIVAALQAGKTVIIDTSKLGDEAELLIGSMIATEAFTTYENYKAEGTLAEKVPISVVIEEAPRVLGSEQLQKGDNIYGRIAREGRKFKVGVLAITQLTSVIPRDILTNINTKIILGNEMATERHALIESAAQDLSDDDRLIASLDKGEAIVTSIFQKFAVPIQIPLFDELVKEQKAPAKQPPLQYTG